MRAAANGKSVQCSERARETLVLSLFSLSIGVVSGAHMSDCSYETAELLLRHGARTEPTNALHETALLLSISHAQSVRPSASRYIPDS